MNIEMPPHYPIVASELTGLMNRIGEGLLYRPQMEVGLRDLFEVIAEFEEKVQPAFSELVPALQALSDYVLAPGMSPSEGQVGKVVDAIAAPVDELLDFLRDLWRRPFRDDLEPGRLLLSAVVKRPLRDVHGMFGQLVEAMADPAAAMARSGGQTVFFRFELNVEEESCAFAEWCDGLPSAGMAKSSPAGRSLLGWAAAFLLGWWWGDD